MEKIAVFFLVLMFSCSVNLLPVGRNLLDLSYLFDDNVIYFPGVNAFRLEEVIKMKDNATGSWLAANKFCGPEHGGTHMDAPYHFNENGWTIDEIPFDRFVAPAAVINISSKVESNANAALEVEDIEKWETEYGPIPNASVILIYSGHGKKWGNRTAYMGIDSVPGTDLSLDEIVVKMNFPAIGTEAAEWLVNNRNIVGVGVDALSLDVGNSTTFPVHNILLKQNIYGLENIANLEKMPSSGAMLYILPMKIKGGSGAPTRVLAQLP